MNQKKEANSGSWEKLLLRDSENSEFGELEFGELESPFGDVFWRSSELTGADVLSRCGELVSELGREEGE